MIQAVQFIINVCNIIINNNKHAASRRENIMVKASCLGALGSSIEFKFIDLLAQIFSIHSLIPAIQQPMADIIQFRGTTISDMPPAQILEAAKGQELTEALVIGLSGDSLYVACSTADMSVVNLLLDRAKQFVLSHFDQRS